MSTKNITSAKKQLLVVNGIDYFLPSNLDLDILLKKHPLTLSYLHKKPQAVKDRLIVILSQLDKRLAFNKNLDLAANNGFVNLNAQILQSTTVKNYKEYVDWLVHVGIWVCDNKYIPNKKSLGYKWATKYTGSKLVKHTVYDYSIVTKLSNNAIDTTSAINYQDLLSDLQSIEVDLAKSPSDRELYRLAMVKSLAEIKKDIKVKKNSSVYSGLTRGQTMKYVRDHAKRKIMATDRVIHEIKNGGWYFKQDTTSRRLHTNITSLKSELRPILTYSGQTLFSMDIKNSQPYMSLALLFRSPSAKIKGIIDEHTAYLKSNHPTEFQQLQKLLATLRSGSHPKDVTDYIQEVTNGTLYNTMMNLWNNKLGKSYNRSKAKEQIFKIFFQPPSFKSKEKQIFATKFPTIWKLISLINTGFTTIKKQRRGGKKYQGNAWAIILQNIESHLVLDVICPSIKIINKHIPLVTIHDSIATTAVHKSYVKTEMTSILQQQVGYKPTIKKEAWL